MLKWFKRLFGLFGNKAHGLLDKFEDPSAAFNQVIADMRNEIVSAKKAKSMSEVQAKKSRISQMNLGREAENYRKNAERYFQAGNEAYARQMIRRAVESEKQSLSYSEAADKLEADVACLAETIRKQELTLEEAISRKSAFLSSKKVNEHVASLSRNGYQGGGSAFSEYERLMEKVADESVEAQAIWQSSPDHVSGDVIAMESSIDTEMEMLKEKFNKVPQLENKEVPQLQPH